MMLDQGWQPVSGRGGRGIRVFVEAVTVKPNFTKACLLARTYQEEEMIDEAIGVEEGCN